MRGLISIACLLSGISTASAETRIDLPGSVFGGVEICNIAGCKRTAGDRETPARIVSFDKDTGTPVQIGGTRYFVPGNQVGLSLKGCQMTLRSYLAHSFCGGKPWPR